MEGNVITDKKRLLHIGCGSQPLPDWLSQFDEVRVDVDPTVNPHFVRDMLDLHDIGTFDMIYSSHCLEHLYPYQVPRALAEFQRVLNPGGSCLIMVPDLEGINPDTKRVMFVMEDGKVVHEICGLDMYYGLHTELETSPYMAHHCGFVSSVLDEVMKSAGFINVITERLENHNLMTSGVKAA